MKSLLFIILISTLTGCCKTTVAEEQLASCPTEELKLTVANENPSYDNVQMGLAVNPVSQIIHGKKIGDTLNVKLYSRNNEESGGEIDIIFLLKQNECPKALSSKCTSTEFWGGGHTTYINYNVPVTEFRVQNYIENKLLACIVRVDHEIAPNIVRTYSHKLWIDLANLKPFL